MNDPAPFEDDSTAAMIVGGERKRRDAGIAGVTTRNNSSTKKYVVRIKVLGLAGILYDNNSQTEGGDGKKELSSQISSLLPSQMKAAIILTRDGRTVKDIRNGRASSDLSLPLWRPPSEDGDEAATATATATSTQDDAIRRSAVSKMSKLAKLTTKFPAIIRKNKSSSKQKQQNQVAPATESPVERYLAIWDDEGGNDTTDDGDGSATLEFETTFARTESNSMEEEEKSLTSLTTSFFAPKSFSIRIVLSPCDASGNDSSFAIPLGVASLAITGDDCVGGGRVVDLPVLSVEAALPLVGPQASAAKDKALVDRETGGKITSLHEMEKRLEPIIDACFTQQHPADAEIVDEKKTKRSLKKKLRINRHTPRSKSKSPETCPSLPTASNQIESFFNKYTIDPTGDAVLRLSVEVLLKEQSDSDVSKILQKKEEIASRSRSPPQSRSGVTVTVLTDEKPMTRESSSYKVGGELILVRTDDKDGATGPSSVGSGSRDIESSRRDQYEVKIDSVVNDGSFDTYEAMANEHSTCSDSCSHSTFDGKSADLTCETETIGTATVDFELNDTMSSSFEEGETVPILMKRLASDVLSLARDTTQAGVRDDTPTGNYLFVGCTSRLMCSTEKEQATDEEVSASKRKGSDLCTTNRQEKDGKTLPSSSAGNSPREIGDFMHHERSAISGLISQIPATGKVNEQQDLGPQSTESAVANAIGTLTNILTCQGASNINTGIYTDAADSCCSTDDETIGPPKEIVTDTPQDRSFTEHSIVDLTNDSAEWTTCKARSRSRSSLYDRRRNDKYNSRREDCALTEDVGLIACGGNGISTVTSSEIKMTKEERQLKNLAVLRSTCTTSKTFQC